MEREERSDRFTAIEDRFAGYTVYDQSYEKIGKVDDLFVDESARPEYIGVKMGFLGTSSTLIPLEMARVNDEAAAHRGGSRQGDGQERPHLRRRPRAIPRAASSAST